MYKEAINKLRSLDLSASNYAEVKALINQFGPFGQIQMPLNPGTSLIRSRPHRDGVVEHFSNRSDLSYKPQHFNTTYQRASTPNQTMFYAGVIPDEVLHGDGIEGRAVATLESSSLLRGLPGDGEQTVTFSRWTVVKPINLIAICYKDDFIASNPLAKRMYDTFEQGLKSMGDDLMTEKSLEITQFLADEFAKPHIAGDHDYLISAIFSEMVVASGMAGIYYPSVRAEGRGFNVAIAPAYVDDCLRLEAAGECTIYRRGMHTIFDNETVCIIADDSKPFKPLPVEPHLHLGKAEVLKRIRETK